MEMAMALLVFLSIFILSAHSDDSTEKQLLNQINLYRNGLGAVPLKVNPGASCLAHKLVDHFKGTPCDNTTEAQTSPGLEPNFPDYPNMLSDCKLNLMNTTGGQVLTDCIPSSLLSSAADTAVQNFTRSQEYQSYINSTDYTSAGVASEDVWFVLVLGTKSTDANYAQQQSGFVPLLPHFLLPTTFVALAQIFIFFLS